MSFNKSCNKCQPQCPTAEIIGVASPLRITNGILNIPPATDTQNGYLTAADHTLLTSLSTPAVYAEFTSTAAVVPTVIPPILGNVNATFVNTPVTSASIINAGPALTILRAGVYSFNVFVPTAIPVPTILGQNRVVQLNVGGVLFPVNSQIPTLGNVNLNLNLTATIRIPANTPVTLTFISTLVGYNVAPITFSVARLYD